MIIDVLIRVDSKPRCKPLPVLCNLNFQQMSSCVLLVTEAIAPYKLSFYLLLLFANILLHEITLKCGKKIYRLGTLVDHDGDVAIQ